MILHFLCGVPLFIWLFLLLARAGFWRAAQWVAVSPASVLKPVNVVAVIPARDEAEVIGDTVQSLLQQEFDGSLQVIIIDDGSTDGTARAAAVAASGLNASERVTLITGLPVAAGWTGKLWAQSQGVAAAMKLNPDYLLLTDADIHHDAGNLASLIAGAQTQHCDLVSFMVRLSVQTFPERCMIPAFVFFFFLLYPPAAIATRSSRMAAAAGGCMLVLPEALERIGGLESIRSQLIDDCALARAIKSSGGSVRLHLTNTARSTRRYGSFGEIGRMISRSAFYQLKHSWVLLAATVIGLGIVYVLPLMLLWSGDVVATAAGAVTWILMSAAYLPMVRFYRLSPLWSVCLPAIALFYAGATLHSAAQYASSRGGSWKGRTQDVRG